MITPPKPRAKAIASAFRMNTGRRRSCGVEKTNITAPIGTSNAGKKVPTMSMSTAEATVLMPPVGIVAGRGKVWLFAILEELWARFAL